MKDTINKLIKQIRLVHSFLQDKQLGEFFKYHTALSQHGLDEKKVAQVLGKLESLKNSIEELSEQEKFYLDSNYNIILLTFYLDDLIVKYRGYLVKNKANISQGIIDNKEFKESLRFWKCFGNYVKKLEQEFVINIRDKVSSIDSKLMRLNAVYAKKIFDEKFADFYKNDKKGYIDKFFRDYNLHGFPDSVLNTILKFKGSRGWNFDYVVCVLRGGIPYTTLFEALGLSQDRIIYLGCSRDYDKGTNEGGLKVKMTYEDPKLHYIKGRKVLIVENNVFEGKTLKMIVPMIKRFKPKKLRVFLDYLGKDTGGLSKEELCKSINLEFKNVHVARSERTVNNLLSLEDTKLEMINRLEKLV